MYSIITAVPMCLNQFFELKPIVIWFLKVQKFGSHKFSWQSLLLSTTLLINNINDEYSGFYHMM